VYFGERQEIPFTYDDNQNAFGSVETDGILSCTVTREGNVAFLNGYVWNPISQTYDVLLAHDEVYDQGGLCVASITMPVRKGEKWTIHGMGNIEGSDHVDLWLTPLVS
jgi:hypothetical protein